MIPKIYSSPLFFVSVILCSLQFFAADLLQAGYSRMFADRSLEIIKNGDRNVTSNWGWIMLRFHPLLFTTNPQ